MAIKLSVIITNWNGKELLKKNLPAVINACRSWAKTDWEIIVVDDASTDDSVAFVKEKYPQLKIVVHQKRRFFAALCNTGVENAKGEIIILLNNDVSPEVGFLEPLLTHFANPEVFAVGCKERDIRDEKTFYSGRGIMRFKRGLVVHWRARSQDEKTTFWVTGGSGAFSREKWLDLGGMDVLFRPAYEEDRDLSYRAMKHGWQVLFEPKSVVDHHHETTNIKAFGPRKIQIISFKNQFLFVWKNITDKGYLLAHLFWLPYHLVFTNRRSRGLLGIGFLLAVKQLPEALESRKESGNFFVKSDRDLI